MSDRFDDLAVSNLTNWSGDDDALIAAKLAGHLNVYGFNRAQVLAGNYSKPWSKREIDAQIKKKRQAQVRASNARRNKGRIKTSSVSATLPLMQLLVVAVQRSGTHYTWEMLNRLNVKVQCVA
jgi:hypothetical protein